MNFKRGLKVKNSLGLGISNCPKASLKHAEDCLLKMGYFIQSTETGDNIEPDLEFIWNIHIYEKNNAMQLQCHKKNDGKLWFYIKVEEKWEHAWSLTLGILTFYNKKVIARIRKTQTTVSMHYAEV